MIRLNITEFSTTQQALRAVNHELRRRILNLLKEGNGDMAVTDIYIKLRLEQSVASQHLAILRKAGIIRANKLGKNTYYSVDTKMLNKVKNMCRDFHAYNEQNLSLTEKRKRGLTLTQ